MSVSLLTAQELLGLFELDGTGKVLYYRMDSGGEPGGTSVDMAGHNFYDEVAPFENVEEFRRSVTEFTRGAKAADSFDFDCHYEDSDHPVRVLLARIRERLNRNNTKSILVHIRPGETLTRRPRNSEVTADERDVDQ
jgi:hypothetical protein